MFLRGIPFGTTDRSPIQETEHEGEADSARWRTRQIEAFLAIALVLILLACTGRSAPQVVRHVEDDPEIRREIREIEGCGLQPNTLWRLEARYSDRGGAVLAQRRFDVVLVPGEWQSELAPLDVAPGYVAFRYPGQLGDGAPDLAKVLRLAPKPLTMRLAQSIVPLGETAPIPVPAGATTLRVCLLEVSPVEVRYMRQINRRPAGDVIVLRTVKEEMRWREYRVRGACREFRPEWE